MHAPRTLRFSLPFTYILYKVHTIILSVPVEQIFHPLLPHLRSQLRILLREYQLGVGLLEFLDQKFLRLYLQPSGVVRLVERILDGEDSLGVHTLVGALVDSYNSIVLVFLPNICRVVSHEPLQNLPVTDPLHRRHILDPVLEHVKHIESFSLALFHPLEFEMGRIYCSVSGIKNWLDMFGTDQVVNQHQDHCV